MILYKRITPEYQEKVNQFFISKGIRYDGRMPLIGFIAVEKETDNIVGAVFAHHVALIEPMACEISGIAAKLYYQMSGALSALGLNTHILHVRSANEMLIKELQKLDYEQVGQEYTVFKKT